MMLFVVTLISLLVHIYSIAYMRGDVRYTYYFAVLSLFTASMLLLVVADNTLQMLVGWELRRPLLVHAHRALVGGGRNSDAALKAFLTTRTGDIGLMIGIIITVLRRGHASTSPASTRYTLSRAPTHTLLLVGALVPASSA